MKALKWTSSPWGFRKTTMTDVMAFLETMGISDICLQCRCGPDMPGLLPVDISDDELAHIAGRLANSCMSVASFNGDGDYMAEDVSAQIVTTMRRLKIAAALGAKTLIVFAGWQNIDTPAIYDQVASAIKVVAQEAAKCNMKVALENHGGLTTTIEQCNRILSGVNEPNVGLNYDPANFLMYGQDPVEAFDRLEHPLIFTHLKSLKFNSDGTKEYCRLDEGVINYRPIMERLLAGYHGFYGLEYEETSDACEGTIADHEHLARIMDEIYGASGQA